MHDVADLPVLVGGWRVRRALPGEQRWDDIAGLAGLVLLPLRSNVASLDKMDSVIRGLLRMRNFNLCVWSGSSEAVTKSFSLWTRGRYLRALVPFSSSGMCLQAHKLCLCLQVPKSCLCCLLSLPHAACPLCLCRFEEPQTFPSRRSDITGTINVPDGDWQLVLNAPEGGVRGSVSALPASVVRVDAVLGSAATVALVSFGGCTAADKMNSTDCGKVSEGV